MDLRLLRYFLCIADTGSVTAASRILYVAQPSLSRQLRRLESELGLDLFDRSDRRLRLTAAGRAFLPVARDLVNRAAVARATAQSLAQGADVRLTLAAHPTTIADVVAPFIVAAGADGVVTNVVETTPYGVYQAVEAGDADNGDDAERPQRSIRPSYALPAGGGKAYRPVTSQPKAPPSRAVTSSTHAGTSVPAGPCRDSWKSVVPSLGARFSSSVRAPCRRAWCTKPAAG